MLHECPEHIYYVTRLVFQYVLVFCHLYLHFKFTKIKLRLLDNSLNKVKEISILDLKYENLER